MKKLLIIIAIVVVGGIVIYATSPYFTGSVVNEAIPDNIALSQPLIDKIIQENMTIEDMMNSDEVRMEMKDMPIYSGIFVGVNDGIHNAEGTSIVLPLEGGGQVLRLENFKSTNGPDLHVYLSVDKQASNFINLGKLKANQGNQNYEIPVGTDLTKYNNVLIWCKPFSVLFGSSYLEPQN